MGFDSLGEGFVGVPRMIVGVGDLGPNDFYDPRPGFYKAPCQEAAIPKSILAVGFTSFVAFLFKSEGFTSTTANYEIERAVLVFNK